MAGSDDSTGPSDTMRGRVGESRWKLWVFMSANRHVIAAGTSLLIFVSLVLLSLLDLSPLRAIVSSHDAIWWTFSPMLNVIVTGVTLVVTINQLVLSQELGPLGDQRKRMKGALDFRRDVEDELGGGTSPPDPASFLEALIDGVQSRANEFEESVDQSRDQELKDRAGDYVETLTDNAKEVGDNLSGSQFGTFDVVFSALNFNYSWKIYEGRRLRDEHEESFTDETRETLDDLLELLQLFGPAREHFKTLYFQWELVNLSRVMLYTSVPALVVAMAMMFYVDINAVTGSVLGIDSMVWLVSGAATVTLTPFVILLSYVLRIATVAKRTLAMGPFILRETERSGNVEWDE